MPTINPEWTESMEPLFSIVVPVYNREAEVEELLASLAAQTARNFEVLIVEDGSPLPCRDTAERYRREGLDVRYFMQPNAGRSPARNFGIEQARGKWVVFFDSDCVIPPDYFATLERELAARPDIDCFGGPDAAHESFTPVQKAINVAMTSFLTTGGIRGGQRSMERFTPRTFNMGVTRSALADVGGFREMFSEDIDMSKRIEAGGYKTALMRACPVWHKRRVSLRKFARQVYVFGMSRITLKLLYPGSMKAVHALPALAVVLGLACVVMAVLVSPWWLLPIGLWLVAVFINALFITRSLRIALLAVPASIVQIGGYGLGFLKAWFVKIVLGRGRDEEQERRMRRGK